MNVRAILSEGNRYFLAHGDEAKRSHLARDGQNPYAVVVCCSDSRVIPERIFHADLGELFVIRVAGNVIDRHALGSIEYAVGHLGCRFVLMLGHTGCGAVGAALEGHAEGFVAFITDEIRKAIGMERDPAVACKRNVAYGMERICEAFASDPAFKTVEVAGAVYDIASGAVEWF